MTFHRYVAPTYYGPTGIDYLNDPVANGFSLSVPVVVDSRKSGGPNEGIYLVAFGEDASSANANRGLKALAENTDALDDMLHRSLAVPSRSGNVTAGAPVSSIILPLNTFVGDSGGYSLDRLFSILDSNGNEIIDASGVKVVVASITGATVGDGFSSGSITLTLNISIPTGTVYYVTYAVRGNLADLPTDALTNVTIQASQEVSAAIENQFRLLQGNSYAWNHAWEGGTTIYSLAWKGLDALYRKSTVRILGAPNAAYGTFTDGLNTAGAGAHFIRDGAGITGVSGTNNTSWTSAVKDPLGSIFKAASDDALTTGIYTPAAVPVTTPLSNALGFAYLGRRRSSGLTGDGDSHFLPGTAAFYAGSSQFHSGALPAAYTYLPAGESAAVATSGDDMLVTVSGNAHFTAGTDPDAKSGIAAGHDLLVLTYNGITRAFVITAVLTATTCLVRTLDGGQDTDFVGHTATINRWVRSYFLVGDGGAQFREWASDTPNPVQLRNFQVLQPPANSADEHVDDGGSYATAAPNAYFGARTSTDASIALGWGGYNTNGATGSGAYERTGALQGDGSLISTHVTTPAVTAPALYTTNASASITQNMTSIGEYTLVLSSTAAGIALTLTAMQLGADYFVALLRDPGTANFPTGQKLTLSCSDTLGNAYLTSSEYGGGSDASPGDGDIPLAPVLTSPVVDVFRIRLVNFAGALRRAIITHHVVAG
jgi:hypothetical protein